VTSCRPLGEMPITTFGATMAAVNRDPTGETTTMGSRYQLTRTSREGGHLLARALSPGSNTGLPGPRFPRSLLFQVVASYFADAAPPGCRPTVGPARTRLFSYRIATPSRVSAAATLSVGALCGPGSRPSARLTFLAQVPALISVPLYVVVHR
jgi:hypothetical protein